jgi:integrase
MAYIQPRKNKNGAITSYTIKVHRGRDPLSGKQLTPYITTWKPPTKMTEKQIEKEINRQALLFEEQCASGAVASNKIKFSDFCKQYLDVMKANLSPTTLDLYKGIIAKALIPMLGHFKLCDIKTAHVQEFVQKLSGTGISASTVQRHLVALKSILSLAVKLGYIPESPAKSEKLILPKIVTPKIEIFTKQDAAEMLAYLEKEDLQFQVLVQLAIHLGARRGELAALKFSDVDFITSKITIERAAIKIKDTPTQLKAPKDYEIRTVTVNTSCIRLIKMLKEEKQREAARLGSAWNEGGWLFTQWNGTIMNPQTLPSSSRISLPGTVCRIRSSTASGTARQRSCSTAA